MHTRVNFEGIMLREISQTEKDKHHMISFICENKNQGHRYRELTGVRFGVGKRSELVFVCFVFLV